MSNEWTPDNYVKTEIENNLWYPIECEKCHTFVLVEDSIDRVQPTERIKKVPQPIFTINCPRCNHSNPVKYSDRVQLSFVKNVGEDELSPLYRNII